VVVGGGWCKPRVPHTIAKIRFRIIRLCRNNSVLYRMGRLKSPYDPSLVLCYGHRLLRTVFPCWVWAHRFPCRAWTHRVRLLIGHTVFPCWAWAHCVPLLGVGTPCSHAGHGHTVFPCWAWAPRVPLLGVYTTFAHRAPLLGVDTAFCTLCSPAGCGYLVLPCWAWTPPSAHRAPLLGVDTREQKRVTRHNDRNLCNKHSQSVLLNSEPQKPGICYSLLACTANQKKSDRIS